MAGCRSGLSLAAHLPGPAAFSVQRSVLRLAVWGLHCWAGERKAPASLPDAQCAAPHADAELALFPDLLVPGEQEYYDKLPEPDDDENDMLDLAFGLTDT